MKNLKRFLMILIALLVVLMLAKNVIAKAALVGGAKAITGLNVSIGSLRVGVLKPSISIREFQVHNPRGFPEPLLLSMPELSADYDLGSCFRGKPHLQRLRLHLQEFTVVRNKEGALNVNAIRALQSNQQPKTQTRTPPQSHGRAPEFQIDALELVVGSVTFKDYTRGTPPDTKQFAVNIDEHYEHITNPYTLAGLIVSRALMKTTVAQLTNFDMTGLQAGVTEALRQSASSFLPVAQQFSQQAMGTANGAAKEAVGTAQQAVRDTTGTLKKLFGQ